jgi:teichuronic acid biosynthesis glycosyltransferase TuaC
MRVLILSNMWPDTAGLFGTFVADQVADLERSGLEMTVLSFDARHAKWRYGTTAIRLRRRLRADRPDLVHAHYGLTGAVAITQRRVPVVTTFHGSDAYVSWQRRVSRIAAARSTPVCVSREIAERLGRPAATILPMGVDTDRFQPVPKADARRELGLDPARPLVLFPGARENAVKRYELFRAALDRVDADELVFQGYDRERAVLALNAADAVLMTSRHEGSPVTVREALACETPVVSVSVGDVPETIDGLPGCSVEPPDASRLAAAIGRALTADRDGSLRARALETSRPAIAFRLREVYAQVLASSRAG